MENFTRLFRGKLQRLVFLLILSAGATLIFQAQAPEDDPNIDRVPSDILFRRSISPPPSNPFVTVLTDAQGYDNFQIGTDNCEPHMSVNVLNPFNFFNAFVFVVTRYTLDGYDWNFTSTGIPATISDPWTTCDSLGNFYFINLNTSGGCYIVKSTNGGVNWGPLTSISCWDKETIVADQSAGPYSNYVYTTNTYPPGNGCTVTRSTNLGVSFTATATLHPHTLPGAMICIGPNGAIQGGCVYVVTYSGSNSAGTYTFHRSTDAGLSFTQMSSQSGISYVGTEISGRSTVNGARTRPYPWIAADNSYGPYRGRLYVVWENNDPPGNGNKSDVFLRYSTNQGATWSSTILVNDNANPQATQQWFPSIWCDKETGTLWINWYDMRNDPNNQMTELYATYSTTGGTSFATNQRVTNQAWTFPGSSCSPPCYKGDYNAIAANRFGSFSTWMDGRFSTQGSFVGYFPDFAMKVNPTVMALNNLNDSGFAYVSVPAVKLYTNKARFTAVVTPTPGNGTITVSFLNRTNSTLQDTLTSYPDSVRVRVRTSGGVTPGTYTVTITGRGRIGGADGTPVHKRTITLTTFTGITPISNEVPDKFYLYQNFPNPFNPVTNIRFDLPKAGHVRLTVYDIAGRLIETLVDDNYAEGKYNVDFNAENLASGVIFYKIESANFTAIRKMILVK